MNGPEFFMRCIGYRLLPTTLRTDDPVRDADVLLGLNLPLHAGKSLRLSSCWMVVTPHWTATSFKLLPDTGARLDMERSVAILEALRSGGPSLHLKLGKRTLMARDLYVTHDPRATRECSQGFTRTYDATKEKGWTS